MIFDKFIKSQDLVWEKVKKEMINGAKTSHWIWFVFPQIKGISISETGIFYSLNSVKEASDYLENDILFSRMMEILNIILESNENDISFLMGGYPDDLKFISSMTLFEIARPNEEIFKLIFKKFKIERDVNTIDIIKNI